MSNAHPAPPSLAALLWLPALGVPARKYERLAAALATRGITCRLHEWRGTGTHPLRAGRQVDWGYRELLEEDIAGALAALRAEHPGRAVLVGGHSIGGQFAVLAAALHDGIDGLVAVGSGVPDWRLFPAPLRWLVGGFGYALPPLTRWIGHYPGEGLRFAGREAGQLMRDWASTVRHGHYDRLAGLPADFSSRLRRVEAPVLGIQLAADWLVPAAAFDALAAATATRSLQRARLDATQLGVPADHFAWMRAPQAVADTLAQWWRAEGRVSP